MENPRVAIIENDPAKRKKYRDAVEHVGGVVISEYTTEEEARQFLSNLDDPNKPVPDVVLTDALLNPSGYKRMLNAWESLRKKADERSRPWPPMPQTDGSKIVEGVHARRDSSWYVSPTDTSGEYPDLSSRIAPIKVLGISDGLGVTGADVERATPQQVEEYLVDL